MSKIGRKAIDIDSVKVDVKDNEVHYKGPKNSGVYVLPPILSVRLDNNLLHIEAKDDSRDAKRLWGLHRALLANCIKGASTGFDKNLVIEGLGFKAALIRN